MKKRYNQFIEEYGRNMNEYLGGEKMKKDILKNSLKDLSFNIDIENYNNAAKEKVMQILINVTSIWSILEHEEVADGE